MVFVESYLMGLITSASYDYFKKKFNKTLDKTFSKIYDGCIEEICKKHGRKSKRFLKRFFQDVQVKKISLEPIKKSEKRKQLNICADKLKKSSEIDINLKKIIGEFYILFKNKIHSNPTFSSKLHELYETQIITILHQTNESIDSVTNKLKDMQKSHKQFENKLFKKLQEDSYIKLISEGGGLPFIVPAHQFRVNNLPLNFIKKNIENFFCYSKENVRLIKENENFLEIEYLPDKEDNVIKLNHDGFPYKIIYPPFNQITIYVQTKYRSTNITIFCAYRKQLRRIQQILFGDLDPRMIGTVSFRKKMKTLSRRFLGEITVFDYDPLIYKPIKLPDGVKIKSKGTRAIMFGEKGFFLRPELKDVLNKTRFVKKNQETDIFYIKLKESKKFSSIEISSFEIDFRGKLVGYFSRSKFSIQEARKILVDFFEKNGIVLFDKTKKHI